MKLSLDPNLGAAVAFERFLPRFYELWRTLANQINNLAAGNIEGANDTSSVAPIMSATQGKFVRNATPIALGATGSQYVIIGWLCVTTGDPATFAECRCATGA